MTNKSQTPVWDEADKLVSFHTLLKTLANDGTVCFNSVRVRRAVLIHLGFKPSRGVLQLLASLRINRVCPLHLDVARSLAGDPALLDRVRGVILDEFLVDLLGFSRVRACLSRNFFTSWQLPSDQEERLWWAAHHLDCALRDSLTEALRIDSAQELLCGGRRAEQMLVRAGRPLPAD